MNIGVFDMVVKFVGFVLPQKNNVSSITRFFLSYSHAVCPLTRNVKKKVFKRKRKRVKSLS